MSIGPILGTCGLAIIIPSSALAVLLAYLIVFGAATFSQLLAFSDASRGLVHWATSFDLARVAMLLTVPIFFPLAATLGFDPIWFGLIILLALEISSTTPPFGLLLFVMKGVTPKETTLREIKGSAQPYMGCSILLVVRLLHFHGARCGCPVFEGAAVT